MRYRYAAVVAVATVAGSLVVGAGSAAAVSTAQEFVSACENNPGNVVTLSQPTKFESSTGSTVNYAVATKCTVVLQAGATLELNLARLAFAGHFDVQGGRVMLDRSHITAPSARLTLAGFEGELTLNSSSIQATTGNLAVGFGQKGKLSMLNSGGWTGGGLDAKGSLTVSSGTLFSGEVVSSGLAGRQGLTLNVNGAESVWKIEKSTLHAGDWQGVFAPLRVNSNASKTSIEWADTTVRGASSVVMALTGSETNVALKSVYHHAGASQSTSLRAMGNKSVMVLENSVFVGSPSVVVETGPEGVTNVTGQFTHLLANSPTGGSVRVAAGAGGSCFVERGPSVGPGGTISTCA